MQPDLATYLAREPFVVLDGAMATELERRGRVGGEVVVLGHGRSRFAEVRSTRAASSGSGG